MSARFDIFAFVRAFKDFFLVGHFFFWHIAAPFLVDPNNYVSIL
jgi:hypothetical protein